MWGNYDPDEWETVRSTIPCRSCNGNVAKCMCHGSAQYNQRRRNPEEIRRIKREKVLKEENEILRQAAIITALLQHEQELERIRAQPKPSGGK